MKCSKSRAVALAALALSYGAYAVEPEPQAKATPAQLMLDRAEKALEQADGASGQMSGMREGKDIAATSRPIVVPGNKASKGSAGARPAEAVPGPVKIVEGSATAKTTVAPTVSPSTTVKPLTMPPSVSVDLTSRAKPVAAVTPISSTGLPALGRPAGVPNVAPAKPVVIQAQNGVNEMVTVSTKLPNRISTPFAKPNVVDFSATEYDVKGSDIYVVPKGTEPIGIFIRDDRPDSPVISLTLVPREIPGVTIIANIDGGYRAPAASVKASDDDRAATGYEDMLRKLMRRLALERPLSGFTETNLEAGAAMIGPLRVIPDKQYSGQVYDVYRYRIVNTEKDPLELSEESFYRSGVKAVAFYPAVRLEQWQETKVFIVTGKEGADDER